MAEQQAGESLFVVKAREILKQAEAIDEYLRAIGQAEPNFSVSSPPHPTDRAYSDLRTKLTEATHSLTLLTNGPLHSLRIFFCVHHDLGAWQTALRFRFFSIVPLDGSMSTVDIANAAQLDVSRTGRILKILATQYCFNETEEDVYEHTSVSAFITRNRDIQAAIGFQADEMFEAASLTASALEKEPYISDAAHSAFNMRFGMAPYEWYASNPERGSRFASAMAGSSQLYNDAADLSDSFPWAALGKTTVVDIGGGSGHISIYLATRFLDLRFIVQDVNPDMLAQGPRRPEFKSVEERVSFMQYNFHDTQPVREDVGVFFMRQILHNYNDETCVAMLKAVVPALIACQPRTRLLINEMILPTRNSEPKVAEHLLRQIDIAMMNGYGAKQRSLKEWTELMHMADSRLLITRTYGSGILRLLEFCLVQDE